jgi:hypothetical protein
LLGVKTVWAFGLTRLCIVPAELGLDLPVTPVPSAGISVRERLRRTLRRLAIRRSYLHLGELLSRSNGVTEYRIYFNRHERRDAATAQALARYPNVKLYGIEGGDHNVVGALARSGGLAGLLPPFAPASSDGR